MKLNKILNNIDYKLIQGSIDLDIDDIRYDSREIVGNCGFVALKGIDHDGHNYINMAINNGAKCVFVCEDVKVDADVTVIKLKDTRKSLAYLSANLFENPGDKLIKIAITGTKGKTTTSWMIKSILERALEKVGVIGTMGTFIDGKLYKHNNTTPESYNVQKYLRMMVDSGCKFLIMEVSSQALKVGRVSNVYFDYAIFTNLSLDHVGPREHPTFEDYVKSKAMLFKQSKVGIFNGDDKFYFDMTNQANCKIYTYGSKGKQLRLGNVKYVNNKDFLGIKFIVSGIMDGDILVSAPGIFSAYNASSAILLCKLLGVDNKIIQNGLKNFSVKGRCEIFNLRRGIKVIIDYAHNKISMESIIKTMKEYKAGRIVVLFGCGGGRSKDRRYELGYVASKYADFSIITTDNPRNDDIDDINKDIVKGIIDNGGEYIIIKDREEAVRYSIEKALDNDIIILMGKGHEEYQDIKGIRYEFSEKKIINEYL